jgi:multiple sugar transport system substrate-binding protein
MTKSNRVSRRQFLKLAGISAGTSLLAACVPVTTAPESAAGEAAPAEATMQKITILSQPSPPEAKGMLPAFKEATGIEGEWNEIPFSDLQAKYATILAGQDSSFDVLYSWDGLTALFGASLFDPLNDKFDQAVLDDIPPPVIQDATVGGSLRVMPFSVLVYVGFYNKDIFEEAGFDPESPPENWQEVFEMAPKLNKETTGDDQTDRYTWLWPLQSSNGVFVFYAIFLNGAAGSMYSADFKSVEFNSAEGLDAMQAVYDSLVTYEVMDPAGWGIGTNEEAHIAYAQGLCAMQIDPGRYHGLYNENPEKSKIVGRTKLGLVPGINLQSGSSGANIGYGINRFSENKEAGLAYLKYFSSLEAQRDMGLNTTQLPVRMSVLADPEVQSMNPTAAITSEQANFPASRFGSPVYFDVAAVFDEQIQNMKNGDISPQEALEMAAADSQALLDEFWQS